MGPPGFSNSIPDVIAMSLGVIYCGSLHLHSLHRFLMALIIAPSALFPQVFFSCLLVEKLHDALSAALAFFKYSRFLLYARKEPIKLPFQSEHPSLDPVERLVNKPSPPLDAEGIVTSASPESSNLMLDERFTDPCELSPGSISIVILFPLSFGHVVSTKDPASGLRRGTPVARIRRVLVVESAHHLLCVANGLDETPLIFDFFVFTWYPLEPLLHTFCDGDGSGFLFDIHTVKTPSEPLRQIVVSRWTSDNIFVSKATMFRTPYGRPVMKICHSLLTVLSISSFAGRDRDSHGSQDHYDWVISHNTIKSVMSATT